jgi:hypothetical protein
MAWWWRAQNTYRQVTMKCPRQKPTPGRPPCLGNPFNNGLAELFPARDGIRPARRAVQGIGSGFARRRRGELGAAVVNEVVEPLRQRDRGQRFRPGLLVVG